jgi:2-polyprenyl-3-methyl-5-hydroxy-6-metoxy-1,4-benzoquinol methylase
VSHPERIVPDDTEPGIVALHLKRYEFARPLCSGRDVLDAACGVGYGTAYLAEAARRVVGVDVDADAIAYARGRYARPNVEFVQQDLAELDLADDSFDVVVSFETIEHLARPDAFLAHAARVLRADGVFVVSTPRVDVTTTSPQNPFHTLELSRDDFESMLGRHFGAVELYGQHRIQTRRHRLLQRADVLGLRKRLPFVRRASRAVAGTPAMDEVTADEIEISRDSLENASELVAVCRP